MGAMARRIIGRSEEVSVKFRGPSFFDPIILNTFIERLVITAGVFLMWRTRHDSNVRPPSS